MKKNVYYRSVYRRDNPIKEFISIMLYDFCSWPRLILEVFIRKNLGRRYFSFTVSVIIFFVLFSLPIVKMYLPWNYGRPSFGEFLVENFTWYCLLFWYLYKCLKRQREVKKTAAGEFDFNHFSRSTGDVAFAFVNLKFRGKRISLRTAETVVEPLFFIGIGLLLLLFGQYTGWFILFCAVCYSISYHAAYWRGDDGIMDVIDEMIANEGMFSIFVDGDDYSTHNGFQYRGPRPADRDFRKRVANEILDEEDEPATAI